MIVTQGDKQALAELLSIVLDDSEYLFHVSKINGKTVDLAEKMMNDLIYCNKATTILFNSLKCIPKSPNVYGWMLGCLPGLRDVVKAFKDQLQSNMICHVHLVTQYKTAMKLTLLH